MPLASAALAGTSSQVYWVVSSRFMKPDYC
jgi:hypothetical protein